MSDLQIPFSIRKNMAFFTGREYGEMIVMYGACNRNASRAAREYAATYPNRRAPDKNVILKLMNRVYTGGTLVPSRIGVGLGARRTARTIRNEEAVLRAVRQDSRRSIRMIGRMLRLSTATVQRILSDNSQHAYHYTQVQDLRQGDLPRRLRFCEWLLQRQEEDNNFVNNIIFTDECHFTREGIFNAHNYHEWDEENPEAKRPRGFQVRWSVNLWVGIAPGGVLVSKSHLKTLSITLYRQVSIRYSIVSLNLRRMCVRI